MVSKVEDDENIGDNDENFYWEVSVYGDNFGDNDENVGDNDEISTGEYQ